MSKFDKLWRFVRENDAAEFQLTFAEIRDIAGLPIDHSFLNYKKELLKFGYEVGKISLKNQTVIFKKIAK